MRRLCTRAVNQRFRALASPAAASSFAPTAASRAATRGLSPSSSAGGRWLATAAEEGPNIRNVAIIAHVDHGKTTLVDQLLMSCEELGAAHAEQIKGGDRMVDSMDQERERGITIISKVTSLMWKGTRLNIVDTPGHADFGGEVERVLRMVDGVVLVVDATDGPNTQTTFVTEKALANGLRPIVVLNKVDRPTRRVTEVENEVFDLLVGLDASDEQLDFRFIYSSAKMGWAVEDLASEPADGVSGDMHALLDTMVSDVPPPTPASPAPEDFAMAVSMTSYDSFVGRLCTGRVVGGMIKNAQQVKHIEKSGKSHNFKCTQIRAARGMGWATVDRAEIGDIVQLAGSPTVSVGDTVGGAAVSTPLVTPTIDPPTLSMTFGQNDSPLAGREGTKLTSEVIKQRLLDETENNVSIEVLPGERAETFDVRARGEMQLGVLIETMRREGYELSVSPPRVLYSTCEETGAMTEPMEELMIEVDESMTGMVMEHLQARRGELRDQTVSASRVANQPARARLTYAVPSRGLVGYRAVFQSSTRGTGVLNRRFVGYEDHKGPLAAAVRNGPVCSMAAGQTNAYGLEIIQARTTLFVGPREETYDGMIIGESSRVDMMNVNPTKAKQLNNIRAAGKDDHIVLVPPVVMTLEAAMGWLQPGELMEVTPKSIRLRHRELDTGPRERWERARIKGSKKHQ